MDVIAFSFLMGSLCRRTDSIPFTSQWCEILRFLFSGLILYDHSQYREKKKPVKVTPRGCLSELSREGSGLRAFLLLIFAMLVRKAWKPGLVSLAFKETCMVLEPAMHRHFAWHVGGTSDSILKQEVKRKTWKKVLTRLAVTSFMAVTKGPLKGR